MLYDIISAAVVIRLMIKNRKHPAPSAKIGRDLRGGGRSAEMQMSRATPGTPGVRGININAEGVDDEREKIAETRKQDSARARDDPVGGRTVSRASDPRHFRFRAKPGLGSCFP